MKKIRILLMTVLCMMVLGAHAQILSRGVTKELAEHRKANISNVIYDLTFNIPANQNEKVTGSIVICFDVKKAEDRHLFPRIRKRLSSRRLPSSLPIRMST